MVGFIEGKEVLFKVAGNIYIVGDCHYGLSDNLNFFEPPSLRVSPSDSVLLSIKRLFIDYDFDLKYSDNNFVSLSNILEEEDDGRINLLHNSAIHKPHGQIPFSGEIKELFLLPKYDFFVIGQQGVERFRMIAPNGETGLGRILYKEGPLHRKIKIRYLFGKTQYIELTHVGSPNVAFTPRIEWDIVDYLESEKSRKIIDCIIRECPFYKKEVIIKLLNSELVFLHALTHASNFPASLDDILNGLDSAIESCAETMCPCSRESLDAKEVEEALYNLRDRGIIFEDDGLFGRTKEDFEEKEDSEEDIEIKDHPD